MGIVFNVLGYIVYIITGLWSTVVCLGIVIDNLGFIGGIIALAIAPITLVFAPLYSGIAENNWFPLILVYGGGLLGYIFTYLGSIINGEK